MPNEINAVEMATKAGSSIGKFVLGTCILAGITVCVFAFGPKYLKGQAQENVATSNEADKAATDGNTQKEDN